MSKDFMTKDDILNKVNEFFEGFRGSLQSKINSLNNISQLISKFSGQSNAIKQVSVMLKLFAQPFSLQPEKWSGYVCIEDLQNFINADPVLKEKFKQFLSMTEKVFAKCKNIYQLVNKHSNGVDQNLSKYFNYNDKINININELKNQVNKIVNDFVQAIEKQMKDKELSGMHSKMEFALIYGMNEIKSYNVFKHIDYIRSIDKITDAREELLTYAKQLSNAGQRRDNALMIQVHNNLNKLKKQLGKIFSESEKALRQLKSQFDDDPERFEFLVNSIYDKDPILRDGKMKTQNWAIQATNNNWLGVYKQAIQNGIDYLIRITTEQIVDPQKLQDSFSEVVKYFRTCKISISGDQVKDPLENMLDDLERRWAGAGNIRIKR